MTRHTVPQTTPHDLLAIHEIMGKFNLSIFRQAEHYQALPVKSVTAYYNATIDEHFANYSTEMGIIGIGSLSSYFYLGTSKVDTLLTIYHPDKQLRMVYHCAVPLHKKLISQHLLLGNSEAMLYADSLQSATVADTSKVIASKAYDAGWTYVKDPLANEEEWIEALERIKTLYGPLFRK